jgi:RecB family endonuclease NucS
VVAGRNHALEEHLEDFLVENWAQTDFGKEYEIFEEDGEKVGQQYPTDTGLVDILAIRKDGKELLVLELKKGRASDAVVGQRSASGCSAADKGLAFMFYRWTSRCKLRL